MSVSESVIGHVYALQGVFDLNTYVCRFLAKRLLSVGDFVNVVPVVSVLKFAASEFSRLVDPLGRLIIKLIDYTGDIGDFQSAIDNEELSASDRAALFGSALFDGFQKRFYKSEYEALVFSVSRGDPMNCQKLDSLVLQSQGTDYEASVAFAAVWFKLEPALRFEFLLEQKETRFAELRKWNPVHAFLFLEPFVIPETVWDLEPFPDIIAGIDYIVAFSLHKYVVNPTLRSISEMHDKLGQVLWALQSQREVFEELRYVTQSLLLEIVAFKLGHAFPPFDSRYVCAIDRMLSFPRLKDCVQSIIETYKCRHNQRSRGPLMILLASALQGSNQTLQSREVPVLHEERLVKRLKKSSHLFENNVSSSTSSSAGCLEEVFCGAGDQPVQHPKQRRVSLRLHDYLQRFVSTSD